jgi:hypothetical protein
MPVPYQMQMLCRRRVHMKNNFKALSENTAEVKLFLDITSAVVSNLATPAPDPTGQASLSNDKYTVKRFRFLSSTIVRGLGYPVDYQANEPLASAGIAALFNQSVYKDHNFTVDACVGMVKNAVYDTESTLKGVNGEIWVDKYLDPLLAHRVETGIVNRCSATVKFEWKQSHEKMKRPEFFDKLGEIIDNQEVRVIVTRIVQIYEISLVPWGADETAQALAKTNQNEINPGTLPGMEVQMNERLKALVKQALGLNRDIVTDIEVEQAVENLIAQNKRK